MGNPEGLGLNKFTRTNDSGDDSKLEPNLSQDKENSDKFDVRYSKSDSSSVDKLMAEEQYPPIDKEDKEIIDLKSSKPKVLDSN